MLEDGAAAIIDDPFLGEVLDGRYKVESVLGEGGMGVVYAARHVVIEKPVAIKILRHEYCRDKGLVERFIREARAASKIGHPNIVDVTDFGRLEDGHIYFVMEYLSGTTLSRVVQRERVPLSRMIDLGVQMCHGLAAAHAKGIVHRDLKPENIFIVNPCDDTVIEEMSGERRDFVKLLDFGIAKFNFGQKTRITRLGSVFGTPQYMSPEQAAGEDADHRGDVYSLGCIFYEMLTSEVPFTSDTFMGTLTKHMFEQPVAPKDVRPDLEIPEALESLILKMLAKDIDDRHQSMAEVSAELERCYGPGLLPARTETTTIPPGPTEVDLRSRARPPEVAVPDFSPVDTGAAEEAEPLLLTQRKRPSSPADERAAAQRRGAGAWIGLVGVLAAAVLGIGGWLVYRHAADRSDPTGGIAREGATDSGAVRGAGEAAQAPRLDASTTVKVLLRTIPTGAQVMADGKLLGRSPLEDSFPRGSRRTYRFRKRGFYDEVRSGHRRDGNLVVKLRRKRSRPPGQKQPLDPSLKDLRNPFVRR